MSSRVALFLTFLTIVSLTVGDGLLSLDSSNGFKGLRRCALGCYNGGIRDGYQVAQQLDCRKPGVVYVAPDNDCFCRPDLQDTAVRYLSNCVFTSCSQNELDVSSATQVYKDYCSSAGYTAAPKSVAAQTTGSKLFQGSCLYCLPTNPGNIGAPTSSLGIPMETGSSESGAPNSTPPSRGGQSGLSIGGIVGIVAGVVGALAAVVGCFFKYKQYQKQKLQGTQSKFGGMEKA